MLGKCFLIALAVGAAAAYPRAVPQHPQQQQVGIPPHLLRQYLAQQQQRDSTPIYEQDGQHTQVLPAPSPQPQQIRYSQVPGLVQRAQGQAPPQYVQQQYPAPAPAPRPHQRPAPQPEDQEDYDPNPSYQFGFDVNDDQYTNYQNRKEQREGNVIKGSYSVVDSDGFIRTVTYTADPKEGFKAEVTRQPTDIVVKVPTPKPQEQQLIQRPIPPQPQQYRQQQQQPQQQQSQQPPQYYKYQ